MHRILFAVAALALTASIARADVSRFLGGGRGDGVTGPNAFVEPWGISVAPDGTVLIADQKGNGIRSLAPGGTAIVQRVAGNYRSGSTGDGGPAKDASLAVPVSAVMDAAHNIYISEMGGRIRMVDGATGIIRTIVSSSGVSSLFGPMQLALTPDGFLLVSDFRNFRVVKYKLPCSPTCGPPTVVAGGTMGSGVDGPAQGSPMKSPKGVAVFSGLTYVADADDGKVRVVLSNGNMITAAQGLKAPTSLAVAPNGDVYVSELTGHRVSRIRGGTVTPVLGNCPSASLSSACVPQSATAPVLSNNPLAQPITNPTGVAVSADGSKLYAGSMQDQIVFVVDLTSGTVAPVTSTSTIAPTATHTMTPTFTVKLPPPTQTATATQTLTPLPTCNRPCQ